MGKGNLTRFGYREDFDWETRFNLKTTVGKYEVSTVDLGLDHSFGMGDPLYYETMIFLKDNVFKFPLEEREENIFEYYQERYTTEEQARAGHQKAIDYVKSVISKGGE